MKRWEMKCVKIVDAEELLKNLWKPFAVSPHVTSDKYYNEMGEVGVKNMTIDWIYFRRQV